MNTTQNRKKLVTHAVGATVAAAAVPALLFLGAGTSHADASSHVSHVFDPGAEVALNPRPLPPNPPDPAPDHIRYRAIFDPGAQVALNPQPLPPDPAPDYIHYRAIFDPGAAVALNPQPLPPGGNPGPDIELH